MQADPGTASSSEALHHVRPFVSDPMNASLTVSVPAATVSRNDDHEPHGNRYPSPRQRYSRSGSLASAHQGSAQNVSRADSNAKVATPKPTGSFWRTLSDYPDRETHDVIQRLTQSNYSLKEIVERAQESDPDAFSRAKQTVESEQVTGVEKNIWSCTPISLLCKQLESNLETGLSNDDVVRIREAYGLNVLVRPAEMPTWRLFLAQFQSPVVILLLVADIISFAFQEWAEGATILIIVIFNAVLATFMEKSAGDALARLASLSSPKCTVIREGGTTNVIDTTLLVPGDIVLLSAGDAVPADVRCIEVNDLKTNEAVLTGESLDIEKTLLPKDTQTPFASNLCFASTNVTSGSGKGIVYATGMETQIGKIARQLAQASKDSKTKKESRLTPLQQGLHKLGGLIALIAIAVLALIIIVAILKKYRDPSRPNTSPVLEVILVAVGFCVSSIPEGLPMVVTICLSLGCKDMVKRNANVRKLPAVETLGSCTVICSDKTGTLTEGKMTASRLAVFCRSNLGAQSGISLKSAFSTSFAFYPTKGFDPNGGLFLESDLSENKKQALMNLYNHNLPQQYDTLLTDYGNPALSRRDITHATDLEAAQTLASQGARAVTLAAFLSSAQTTELYKDPETSNWATRGNMSEGALLVAAAKCRWSAIAGMGEDPRISYETYKPLNIAFTSSRKMMASIHKLLVPDFFDSLSLRRDHRTVLSTIEESATIPTDRVPEGPLESALTPFLASSTKRVTGASDSLRRSGTSASYASSPMFPYIAILKGAPDRLIPSVRRCLTRRDNLCIDWREGGEVTDAERRQALAINDSYAGGIDGLRVLAVCLVPLTAEHMSNLKNTKDTDERLALLLRHPNITLLGLIGSFDPPRFGIQEAVNSCNRAGIRVVMITGDQVSTAASIARSIGILSSNKTSVSEDTSTVTEVLQCSQLHINQDPHQGYLDDAAIDWLTSHGRVFSRAQPEDKLVIVNSFKRCGEVVAMTGDGVNDAPALQAAHIGIAMGKTGSDVAKGAADMVLLDDNFCTIVSAVEEGRKIYGNIQKFVSFLLGTNIGEIVYLLVAILAGMKMPVDALQILFLNLMSDGCPAVALVREPADSDNMERPPRHAKSHIMTRDWWLYGNIPHTVFQAFAVLGCLMLAMYLCTGTILVNDTNNQCYKSSSTIYYCQSARWLPSFEAPNGVGGFYTSIDYFEGGSFHQLFHAIPGRYNEQLSPSNFIHLGVKGCDGAWCVPPPGFERQTAYLWVNALGTQLATTQTFITAVYCEMLRAYTVRSWDPFYKVFNRNPWLHLACSISACMTLLATVIPGVSTVFGLRVLSWWQYCSAIGFALATLVLDEVIPKPLYRRKARRQKLQRLKAMQAYSDQEEERGNPSPPKDQRLLVSS